MTLLEYMHERYRIFLKKEAGEPWPWTEDEILQTWSFCNVFREDDKVTRQFAEMIREPFADNENLWFMYCIARIFNWPDTIAELVGDEKTWPIDAGTFDINAMADAVIERSKSGQKVYTGAYMVRAENDRSVPWFSMEKPEYICKIVCGHLWNDRDQFMDLLDRSQSLQECWHFMQNPHYRGWGPFMAYEVVTDWRHQRYLKDATDIMTWANAGPGALRGLNRMHGRVVTSAVPNANAEMHDLLVKISNPTLWPEEWPSLEMRDIEHSLCELDKYIRTENLEGTPRARYSRFK